MAHFTVKVAPDGSGSDVDFQTLDTAAVRQTMTWSDATVSAADARVLNVDAGASDFGGVVRPIVTANTVTFIHAANSNNATVIKNALGRVYHVRIYNTTSTTYYCKFYNKSTTPNPAADTIFYTVPCQAGIWTIIDSGNGQNFGTGIGLATVAGLGLTDNTSVPASSLLIHVEFK